MSGSVFEAHPPLFRYFWQGEGEIAADLTSTVTTLSMRSMYEDPGILLPLFSYLKDVGADEKKTITIQSHVAGEQDFDHDI